MKKIIFLTLRWQEVGGYHSYVRHLYQGINFSNSDWLATVGYCNLSGREKKKKLDPDFQPLAIGVGDKLIMASRKFLEIFDVIHLFHLPYQIERKQGLKEKFYRILDFKKPLFVTIHDPAEEKSMPYGIRYLKERKNTFFFFVGEMSKNYFEKHHGFMGKVIKHPYFPSNKNSNLIEKENLAINTSRIDFDKYIHLILEAIPEIKGKVRFFSGYKNPFYYWHYCRNKIEKYWIQQGFQPSESELSRIYSKAKVLIDMSKIQNDGNRTQYPLLEAMDFQAVPILRKGWFQNNPDFKIEENFLEAETPKEIAEQTNRVFNDEKLRIKIVKKNQELLKSYDAKLIAKKYTDTYETVLGLKGE